MSAGIIILGVFVGIVILLLLITLHEFAHFVIAKMAGAYVYEFSIGIGPALISWKRKETEYKIRLLPFGGYVHIASETQDPPEHREKEVKYIPRARYMEQIPKWKRFSFILAGALFNFFIAVFLLTTIYTAIGYKPNDMTYYGATYTQNAPAANAIRKTIGAGSTSEIGQNYVIEQYTIYYKNPGQGQQWQHIQSPLWSDYPTYTTTVYQFLDDLGTLKNKATSPGDKTTAYLVVNKVVNSLTHQVFTVPPPTKQNPAPPPKYETALKYRDSKYSVGIAAPNRIFGSKSEAYRYGWQDTFQMSGLVLKSLGNLFTGQFQNLSGPVGIAKSFVTIVNTSVVNVFLYAALISANLFVLNLVPFPPLDGYKFWELAVETIIRRPLSHKVKIIVNSLGAVVFILLFLGITIKDIL